MGKIRLDRSQTIHTNHRKNKTKQNWRQWCYVRQEQHPYQTNNSMNQCTCMWGRYWWLCRTHTMFSVQKTSHLEKRLGWVSKGMKSELVCESVAINHSKLTLILFDTTATIWDKVSVRWCCILPSQNIDLDENTEYSHYLYICICYAGESRHCHYTKHLS